jgi:hypothetical protein
MQDPGTLHNAAVQAVVAFVAQKRRLRLSCLVALLSDDGHPELGAVRCGGRAHATELLGRGSALMAALGDGHRLRGKVDSERHPVKSGAVVVRLHG